MSVCGPEKINCAMEFSLLELMQLPNFIINKQF